MIQRLITLIFVMASFQAHALSDVDLRPLLGPARDQGNTNLCFAHAAADALTVRLHQRVSALTVAFRYYQLRQGFDAVFFNPISPNEGGLASNALRTAIQKTVCTEEESEKSVVSYSGDHIRDIYYNYEHEYRRIYSPQEPTETIKSFLDSVQRVYPGLNVQSLYPLMSKAKPLPTLLGEWLDGECHLKIEDAENIEVVGSELTRQSPDEIISIINQALDQGQVPIVHYNPSFMRNAQPEWYKKFIGTHVSSIAGRKVGTSGTQLYLIRNSWGDYCGEGDYQNYYQHACEKGHIWVPESDLRKYATSATYLK